MKNYVLTGASDDLLEIDGDERDEFGCYDTAKFFHFSDGLVVRGEYCPDEYPGWRIDVVKEGTATTVDRKPLDESSDDPDPYWDTVTVTGDVKFVGCFGSIGGPTGDECRDWLSDNASVLSEEKARAAYFAAKE